MEISSCAPIPLLRPGSVHSGSVSWDDCGWVFLDEVAWICFSNRFQHYSSAAESAHPDLWRSKSTVVNETPLEPIRSVWASGNTVTVRENSQKYTETGWQSVWSVWMPDIMLQQENPQKYTATDQKPARSVSATGSTGSWAQRPATVQTPQWCSWTLTHSTGCSCSNYLKHNKTAMHYNTNLHMYSNALHYSMYSIPDHCS